MKTSENCLNDFKMTHKNVLKFPNINMWIQNFDEHVKGNINKIFIKYVKIKNKKTGVFDEKGQKVIFEIILWDFNKKTDF